MEPYATHLYTLEKVFKAIQISNVLEFGMGFSSTPFFLTNAQKIVSIEMQNEDWYEKVINKTFDINKFIPVQLLGPAKAIDFIKGLEYKFDLIFVDGHGDSRWEAINISFEKTDVIVAHDTETDSYNWNNVRLPQSWRWFDMTKLNPWTSIITNREDLIEFIQNDTDKSYIKERIIT